MEVYKEIQNQEVEFPEDVEDLDFKRLILRLLNKAPESRVIGSMPGLMADDFFNTVEWEKLLRMEVQPPFLPEKVDSPKLSANSGKFDKEELSVQLKVPKCLVGVHRRV
jgi:hypothetical protein